MVTADYQLRGADGADNRTRHWLQCHAARVSLGVRWRDAQARTTAAARLGLARWDNGSPETSWKDSAWLALVSPFGVRFATSNFTNWSTEPRASKSLRKAANVAREQARHDAMWAASNGACLTCSDADGWHVTDAIAPVDLDVFRRRLLGWQNGRPWCWLYRSAERRFVARWDHAPLQALGATPREAIATLRRCAIDYQRICQITLPIAPQALTIAPEPIATQSTTHYRFSVGAARCAESFWSHARILAEAARKFHRESGSWQPNEKEQNGG
ncbi:hypothetical protein [Paraburkholderia rhynchosiae]|uniref:Uncharacterized protein n=1 Tax=Paraburkholderia rhynchosiae TaxID=487049 RepID=A0A6J5CWU5_9BURK|nr:hypothetical protein [Paraburkholderia rhynchosiae]CAB3744454.1 hypothetical protein LMG27174_07182 [Paraburkholderia rhynchosiae]